MKIQQFIKQANSYNNIKASKPSSFPIASKTTVEEARKQLVSYLFSNDTWKKISK